MDTELKVYALSNGNFWAEVVAHSTEEAIALLEEDSIPEDSEPYHVFRVTENESGHRPGLIDSGGEGN